MAAGFELFSGRNNFNIQGLGEVKKEVTGYGEGAPLIVVGLIILSTLIPPLPLPVPLIEMAAGVLFGFGEGWFFVWVGQIAASLAAFEATKMLGKTVVGRWLTTRQWGFYRRYITKRGAKAVMITRATLAAPFNIVSFMAGLTSMKTTTFLKATAVGVIPETVLYTFIGWQLRALPINFVTLSTIILAISLAGFGFTAVVPVFDRYKTKRR